MLLFFSCCNQQVEDGAMVIDINLDDGLLDGMAAMQKFCKIAVTEPDVSKVMDDSERYANELFLDRCTYFISSQYF